MMSRIIRIAVAISRNVNKQDKSLVAGIPHTPLNLVVSTIVAAAAQAGSLHSDSGILMDG